MQVFDVEEWQVGKGEVEIQVDERHQVEIVVSCTQDVQLLGLFEKTKIPLKIGREFRVKAQTRGFHALMLKGKPAVEFGFRVREIVRQDGELLNDDNPPSPPMPGANNLVAQMRAMLRDEFRRNRPPVLEPEDLPFSRRYELDDEDDFRFEEDIFEERRLASEQNDGEKPPEPSGEETSPPPSAEAAQEQGNAPPPKQAAE